MARTVPSSHRKPSVPLTQHSRKVDPPTEDERPSSPVEVVDIQITQPRKPNMPSTSLPPVQTRSEVFRDDDDDPVSFFLQPDLPMNLKLSLTKNIAEGGGLLVNSVPLPPSGIILVDPRTPNGKKFIKGQSENWKVVSYTFIRACAFRGRLLSPEGFTSNRGQIIVKPVFEDGAGNPIKSFVHPEAYTADQRDAIKFAITKHGGNTGISLDRAQVIIAGSASSASFHNIQQRYRQHPIYVEPTEWVTDCVRRGFAEYTDLPATGVRNVGGRTTGAGLTEYVDSDDRKLVEFLAQRRKTRLDDVQRASFAVYSELSKLAKKDEAYRWFLRHTESSWQNRYARNKVRLDGLIDVYIQEHPELDLDDAPSEEEIVLASQSPKKRKKPSNKREREDELEVDIDGTDDGDEEGPRRKKTRPNLRSGMPARYLKRGTARGVKETVIPGEVYTAQVLKKHEEHKEREAQKEVQKQTRTRAVANPMTKVSSTQEPAVPPPADSDVDMVSGSDAEEELPQTQEIQEDAPHDDNHDEAEDMIEPESTESVTQEYTQGGFPPVRVVQDEEEGDDGKGDVVRRVLRKKAPASDQYSLAVRSTRKRGGMKEKPDEVEDTERQEEDDTGGAAERPPPKTSLPPARVTRSSSRRSQSQRAVSAVPSSSNPFKKGSRAAKPPAQAAQRSRSANPSTRSATAAQRRTKAPQEPLEDMREEDEEPAEAAPSVFLRPRTPKRIFMTENELVAEDILEVEDLISPDRNRISKGSNFSSTTAASGTLVSSSTRGSPRQSKGSSVATARDSGVSAMEIEKGLSKGVDDEERAGGSEEETIEQAGQPEETVEQAEQPKEPERKARGRPRMKVKVQKA